MIVETPESKILTAAKNQLGVGPEEGRNSAHRSRIPKVTRIVVPVAECDSGDDEARKQTNRNQKD